jgi:1-acyl-sn-glycerol-3-phosphate acyltransferase
MTTMQTLRIPATEHAAERVTAVGAIDASELRIALNRLIFRGMLFGCGAVAVGLHQVRAETAWAWAKLSARNLARATSVKVEIFGLENLPDEPSVITPNHASHFDIAALLGFLPGNNRFAAKRELFREPVLGMVMKTLGMIPIDRDDPAESIARLNRLQDRGAFSLIMFPEGTRSPDGRMLDFKKGAFTLAIKLGRPVVPIAIHGTSGVMPRGRYLSILPGTVVLEVLPRISTAGLGYADRDGLREETARRIRQRLAAVRPESARSRATQTEIG